MIYRSNLSASDGWKSLTLRLVALLGVFMLYCTYTQLVHDPSARRQLSSQKWNWYDISSSSDGRLKAAVVDIGFIYLSNDLGNTWTPEVFDEARSWRSVTSSTDGSRVAAVASNEYLYTAITQEGANVPPQKMVWTVHDSDVNPGRHNWCTIDCSSSGARVAAAVKNGLVYIGDSTYDAVAEVWSWSWTNCSSHPGEQNWADLTLNGDGSRLVAVVNGGYIYAYEQNTDTWTQLGHKGNWVSVSGSSSGLILAAVDHGGYLYISENFGNSWTAQVELGEKMWYDIIVSGDGSKMFAIDDGGYVYKSTIGDFTRIWTKQSYGQRARWHALTLVERVAMFNLLLNYS